MKLIENWAEALWRAWSIRLAMIAGVVGGYFAAYPAELQKLVSMVPEEWRPLASIVVGILIFSTATGARLVQQKKPSE
jgi:fructose-specific phosphotransferase system IIC component